MKTLHALIKSHETWLTDHVIQDALRHGYTVDSSTLEQSWRAAVCGFSEPMLNMLEQDHYPLEITRENNSNKDTVFAFAETEAHLHRERGVPLAQFMGLTKYYRRAYLNLIEVHVQQAEEAARYRGFIELFFDRVEIDICAVWDLQSESEAIRDAAQANRQLANEKNRCLTIFESLNEPVLILREDRHLINLNLAAHHLFDEAAITGQAYYPGRKQLAVPPQIKAMMAAAGRASDLEYVLETSRGPRCFHVKIQQMLDVSKKFSDTVVILSDITDFRAAQSASETADKAKNAFLATMSHEIRTPINGILGIAQLLRSAPLNRQQSDYVDALLSSGELLLDLVNDVLDYTKLEAGEGEEQPVTFSPREMVDRIARLSMGEAARKGLQLDVKVADACPPAVRGDLAKIQRILLNLINNAVKFTQTGSVTILLDADEGRLVFTVRDTGPGIPDADKNQIFNPFFQSRHQGNEPPLGTGLGLPICARLAELIGADLVLETPRGGGTLFQLTCPIKETDATLPDVAHGADSLGDLDILLVEDNPVNALVIDGFLASDGHRIDAVTSGEAALEHLETKNYDIVLMDLRLQGVDGFETVRRIRASTDPLMRSLPILILTADQSEGVADKIAGSGANAFQMKPLNRDELRRAIARAMVGQSKPNREAATNRDASDPPVLDRSVIADHRDAIGEARTDRIIAAFLETVAVNKSALGAAAETGDRKALADMAHNLRSSAQSIGLLQLADVTEKLERQITSDTRPAELGEAAKVLAHCIDEGAAALRRMAPLS